MRILGIDFGQKRTGLAISDPMGWTAQAVGTIESEKQEELFASLAEIIEEREVSEIVVGLPRNMDGSAGRQAKLAEQFGDALKELFNLPVVMWDERMSTMEAHRALLIQDVTRSKRKKIVDRVAAQLILQSYLDNKNKDNKRED